MHVSFGWITERSNNQKAGGQDITKFELENALEQSGVSLSLADADPSDLAEILEFLEQWIIENREGEEEHIAEP